MDAMEKERLAEVKRRNKVILESIECYYNTQIQLLRERLAEEKQQERLHE